MATNTNTIKTRVQLKSDTEENWNKAGPKNGSLGFVPLLGELIVYTADTAHPFSRLKIGDGATNVVELPFIDAGTVGGIEPEFRMYADTTEFPQPGDTNKLYMDLSTGKLYQFIPMRGYVKIYQANKSTVSHIVEWRAGVMTTLSYENGTLQASNGIAPSLSFESISAMTDIVKGV